MNASTLPRLSREAHKRIKYVLEEAQARLQDAFIERALKAKKLKPASIVRRLKDRKALLKYAPIDLRDSAAVRYFDAMAWEYMISRSAAEFEALIEKINQAANRKFKGTGESVRDRKQEWLTEARERAAQDIVGEGIPLRSDPKQARVFRKLRIKFARLPASGPDLHALFDDGGRKHIVIDGRYDPHRNLTQRTKFNQLARQAMATLGFRFTNLSRTADYWLDLLRQENPHRLKGRRIPGLCVASAEFCGELETRALEASVQSGKPRSVKSGRDQVPQTHDEKTSMGRNIDRLRKECGWSFESLAKATDLDKKLILGHVSKGKGAHPDTLANYARTFSEKLGRTVTVAELES